jgi:hypothetical protein
MIYFFEEIFFEDSWTEARSLVDLHFSTINLAAVEMVWRELNPFPQKPETPVKYIQLNTSEDTVVTIFLRNDEVLK